MPEPYAYTAHLPLPPLHGMLVVDAKDSTRLPTVEQAVLSRMITELVDRGLDAAGLGTMEKVFPNNTGDGLAFGFDPVHLPSVVFPFIDDLDEILLHHNARTPAPPIRLRLSVHVGHVPVTGGLPGDGNARPRSEAHRLLDSQAARQYLVESDANATPLVAIISDRVYQDVVVGGYCGLRPQRLTEVVAEVEGKDFAQTAWAYVPSPSGGLLRPPHTRGSARRAADRLHAAASTIAPVGEKAARDRLDRTRLRDGDAAAVVQTVDHGVAVMNSEVREVHSITVPRSGPAGQVGR